MSFNIIPRQRKSELTADERSRMKVEARIAANPLHAQYVAQAVRELAEPMIAYKDKIALAGGEAMVADAVEYKYARDQVLQRNFLHPEEMEYVVNGALQLLAEQEAGSAHE